MSSCFTASYWSFLFLCNTTSITEQSNTVFMEWEERRKNDWFEAFKSLRPSFKILHAIILWIIQNVHHALASNTTNMSVVKGSDLACVLFTHIAEVNDRPISGWSALFFLYHSTLLSINRLKARVSQEKQLFCMDISVSW